MKVSGSASAWYSPPSATNQTEAAATDFVSLLAATQTDAAPPAPEAEAAAPAEKLDFKNMTRQQLRDWANSEFFAGRMTLEESGMFMGLTIKLPVAGEPEDDCPNDPTRFNFMERTRAGIEGALWRHDRDGAERLRTALDQMKAAQAA
jgi:hypothetical protein